MTSTNDNQRTGRHTVSRSRRAASARKAAESSETARPLPGSWPAAQPGTPAPATAAADSSEQDLASAKSPEHNSSERQHGERRPSEAELARREAVQQFPYVAVSLGASGIHPATSRLISFDAVTYNAEGGIGDATFLVFCPDSDPGPKHQHGLSHEEVSAGIPFSKALKRIDRIIDDRTIIVHDATVTWGFLVSEARRAMTAAARQNRSRNRNGRSRSRRIKVGHIPRPQGIIDTLATARRHELPLTDLRLASVALATGIPTAPPTATVERAQRSAEDTARAETNLLWQLHSLQAKRGDVVCLDPSELRADKFGLQRSHIRVDAMDAPRMHHNPGPYVPGRELVRGMEFVVAPEIAMDPDIIIEAGVREELNYVEKLSRETSVVVCNITTDLVGKAMHADRKDIPLMSDEAFLAALKRIEEAGPKPQVEEKPATAPRPQRRNPNSSSAPRRSNTSGNASTGASSSNTGGSQSSNRRRRRRRSGSGSTNAAHAGNHSQGGNSQNNNQGQDTAQGSAQPQTEQGAQSGKSQPGKSQDGNNHGGNNQSGNAKSSNRRRRRGGRGGRNRNRSRNQDNRGSGTSAADSGAKSAEKKQS
ncbi:DNA polymerase III subunit epsilon [Corynebacterium stationis]|uniref:DNA polymerase III subunit epsilon n=1 Tax=Corynebacterium stationis TaxID=1705 RepID=UPI00076F8185|nr:DNA polymerase III subunit epsilon [Corynebacterium stationis]AMJ43741.1 DNA polymerase III subunit epsilon [Corynebacterium stationis]AQX70191.1 DNA polymerase III subunit epsilon [Corynebacterium stationis]ASJ17892.1 DNA polymerase III subunit epsilon [Corynebacterium stationis]HJG65555.1 DNA polymerase III subunit epsilon [Corynebacterium stationis]